LSDSTRSLAEVSDITTGRLDSNAATPGGNYPFFTCSPETFRIDNYAFDCEAVLLAGNNANGVFSVKHYAGKFNAYQRTYVITSKDPNRVRTRYLYYAIKTLTSRLQEFSIGSATKFLTLRILNPLTFRIPDIYEQDRIVSLLGGLDDKIEVNRRINETLEGLARAIFKSWFVDFDPIAKRDRVDSELGLVPRGWQIASLGDHAEAIRGLSYKGEGLSSEGMPMHNLNSIFEGGGYKYEGIKYYTGEFKDRHLLKAGDLIIANTEQGFDYLLIGYPAIVPRRFGEKGLLSHHLFRVTPRTGSPVTRNFLYYLLMTPFVRDQVIGCTNGTTVNALSIDGLTTPRFVLPPATLIQKFEALAAPIQQLIEANTETNETLAELRDTLLPKLLSGEIRVDAGNRAVGAAL
jgi:type I restriction enzyme, S subunit